MINHNLNKIRRTHNSPVYDHDESKLPTHQDLQNKRTFCPSIINQKIGSFRCFSHMIYLFPEIFKMKLNNLSYSPL